MTRCYAAYCGIHHLESCKSDTQLHYIYKYMDIMREHGVKFDKTPEDEELFNQLQQTIGTEGAVTQSKTKSIQYFESKSPVDGENCTLEECQPTQKSVHVSQNTGNNEWYTPPAYIEAATSVMGEIDVDPASAEKANEIVGAKTFYTSEQDGRKQEWKGRVWMNPPYAQPLVTDFCDLFTTKYDEGEIEEGCVLVNNATETAFFQGMLQKCAAVCFVRGRIAFLDKNGRHRGKPLQGQAVLYFGEQVEKFTEQFNKFGVILYAGRN